MIAIQLLCLSRGNDAIRMLMPRYITRSCVYFVIHRSRIIHGHGEMSLPDILRERAPILKYDVINYKN